MARAGELTPLSLKGNGTPTNLKTPYKPHLSDEIATFNPSRTLLPSVLENSPTH